jgi:GDPmannose 4,6-dehydratase
MSRPRFHLHYGDLTDATNLIRIVQETQPDEIYNLGAQSHVRCRFESPEYTADVPMPWARCACSKPSASSASRRRPASTRLQHLRALRPGAGGPAKAKATPFYPRSPYAVAKLYAYWIVVNYREAYGMYACNGILFNHEIPAAAARPSSPARSPARRLAIHLGKLEPSLYMGNLDSPARLGACQGLRAHAMDDAAAGRNPKTSSSPPACSTACASSSR